MLNRYTAIVLATLALAPISAIADNHLPDPSKGSVLNCYNQKSTLVFQVDANVHANDAYLVGYFANFKPARSDDKIVVTWGADGINKLRNNKVLEHYMQNDFSKVTGYVRINISGKGPFHGFIAVNPMSGNQKPTNAEEMLCHYGPNGSWLKKLAAMPQ